MPIEPSNDAILNLASDSLSVPALDLENKSNQLAMKDIVDGIRDWRIWLLLSYQDIKVRYRRSALGPFWITISMGITVFSMGFLYGHLFRTNLSDYFPFLTAGLLGWSLLSAMITDLNDAFATAEGLIKQIKLPYSLYIHRVISRNFIIFFHNLIVMIPIIIIFYPAIKVNAYTLLLIPNLILIYLNAFSYGLILAMIGARYRDIPQIIRSLIQVVFFVTPIIWNPTILPKHLQILVTLNPFYAFVELIRAPLIGVPPTVNVMLMAIFVTLIGMGICAALFSKYRSRIVYWL